MLLLKKLKLSRSTLALTILALSGLIGTSSIQAMMANPSGCGSAKWLTAQCQMYQAAVRNQNIFSPFVGTPFFPMAYPAPSMVGQMTYYPPQTVWNGGVFSTPYIPTPAPTYFVPRVFNTWATPIF